MFSHTFKVSQKSPLNPLSESQVKRLKYKVKHSDNALVFPKNTLHRMIYGKLSTTLSDFQLLCQNYLRSRGTSALDRNLQRARLAETKSLDIQSLIKVRQEVAAFKSILFSPA